MSKLTLQADKSSRLVIVQRMFTDKWQERNNAKVTVTDKTMTIEGDKKLIDLVIKQKARFFEREKIEIVMPKETKAKK